jgi:hypothetical protein
MVIQITEGSGFGGAGFNTGRYHIATYLFPFSYSLVYPVKAKGAFLNHTTHPLRERPGSPGSTVWGKVRAVIFFFCLVFKVKIPHPIGAGNDTVSAPDTAPEILDDNAIITMIGCLGRTHGNAGGLITVHAGHRYNLNPPGGVLTLTDSQHPVPVYLSSPPLLWR